ncbi:MAG TPA: sigma 54-interacting transcriptional regulator [Spirochaetia bacterium]|nr:sigma 54-interacting transcriptional regulator [Spirochaetia bacterium]
MSRLSQVQEECQRVASVIASVLGVEVEIIDRELFRVAGTGQVRNDVGSRLLRGFVNKHVLKHGEAIFIGEAGRHAICTSCPLAGRCFYLASIVYPILVEDGIAGTISLIAFSEEQKVSLRERTGSLTDFIGGLAGLIGALVLEKEAVAAKMIMASQLDAVMDAVDESVVAVDGAGRVTHFNLPAERMFSTLREEIIGHPLEEHVKGLPLRQILEGGGGFSSREVFATVRDRRAIHLLVTAQPINDAARQTVGVVVTARDFKETQKRAYELVSSQRVITFADLVGTSPALVELKKRAARVAFSDSTILITGESGTGKEVLTRGIHAASPRHDRPFVAINCGAIPESLLESELFGYEEGSFTGALRGGKPGKFELANHGTIFLDEIGNMSLYLQAKLLRVLQERQIERVGALKPTAVDVRVIAATNQDLEDLMLKGHFREDLFYRLSVIPVRLPPLRERPEDIPLLLDHYRRYFNDLLAKNIEGFTPAAMSLAGSYAWPGNVRELINAVEYAVNLADGASIDVTNLPGQLRDPARKAAAGPERLLSLQQLEREAVEAALRKFGWTDEGKSLAARALGVSRATIYRKISRYRLANRSQ